MNRDILNVIFSKAHIKCYEKMAQVSSNINNMLRRNDIYKDKMETIYTKSTSVEPKNIAMLEFGMYCAASSGYTDLIELYIEKYASVGAVNDWNDAMNGAVLGNQMHLIKFCIEKGANDWNSAMSTASGRGNQNLVEFFIAKGATNYDTCMAVAAKHGHKHLIDLFIDKCAMLGVANDWNFALRCASAANNRDLIEFFIEKGANNWNECMEFATLLKRADLVEFFQKKIDQKNQ